MQKKFLRLELSLYRDVREKAVNLCYYSYLKLPMSNVEPYNSQSVTWSAQWVNWNSTNQTSIAGVNCQPSYPAWALSAEVHVTLPSSINFYFYVIFSLHSSKRRSFFCKLEHYTVVGLLLEQRAPKNWWFWVSKNCNRWILNCDPELRLSEKLDFIWKFDLRKYDLLKIWFE